MSCDCKIRCNSFAHPHSISRMIGFVIAVTGIVQSSIVVYSVLNPQLFSALITIQ